MHKIKRKTYRIKLNNGDEKMRIIIWSVTMVIMQIMRIRIKANEAFESYLCHQISKSIDIGHRVI